MPRKGGACGTIEKSARACRFNKSNTRQSYELPGVLLYIEVKSFSVDKFKIFSTVKIESSGTDKSGAGDGYAFNTVKLFFFLAAFFECHRPVEVFAVISIILFTASDNTV
jgi:hypothetical protein